VTDLSVVPGTLVWPHRLPRTTATSLPPARPSVSPKRPSVSRQLGAEETALAAGETLDEAWRVLSRSRWLRCTPGSFGDFLVLGVREEAEDVAQDAYERAYRSWDGFDGRDPRAWLYTIGLRLAFNS